MFAFGFGGFTFAEIAEEMAASVMWVEVAVRTYPWLEEARQAGVSARDRDRVLRAERSADKLIDGHKLAKQKVTTLGDVIDYEEEVSPSSEMVKPYFWTVSSRVFIASSWNLNASFRLLIAAVY